MEAKTQFDENKSSKVQKHLGVNDKLQIQVFLIACECFLAWGLVSLLVK